MPAPACELGSDGAFNALACVLNNANAAANAKDFLIMLNYSPR
jgi:hypothetical protein